MHKLLLIGLSTAMLSATACSNSKASQTSMPHATDAATLLASPLTADQFHELVPAMLLMINGNYSKAAPTLSKYALLGSRDAQTEIGFMYLDGAGLPLDRDEALKWLALAAAQGTSSDRETLAQAIEGSLVALPGSIRATLQTEQSVSPSGPSYQSDSSGAVAAQSGGTGYASSTPNPYSYAGSTTSPAPLNSSPPSALSRSIAETSNYARPQYTESTASTIILNPSSPGLYSGTNGDTYTQAGPKGVVNARTGEFSTTN